MSEDIIPGVRLRHCGDEFSDQRKCEKTKEEKL
jgi:hypothetical protein